MPKRLPLSIVFSGFLGTVAHAVRFWLHYTVVAIAWLGVVPLTACRSGSHYMSGGGGAKGAQAFQIFGKTKRGPFSTNAQSWFASGVLDGALDLCP